MNTNGFLLFVLILFAACADTATQPAQKQAKEVMHHGEGHYRIDSTWVQGKDTFHFSLGLEAVPNHFIMVRMETDSFFEAHYFEDLQLVMRVKSDSFVINKDSLLPFVNDLYLNEALISDLELIAFDPKQDYYLFEFAVKKPQEDFRFRFTGTLLNKELLVNIIDE